MSNIVDYLQQLDLSELEAKLYLALLESGPVSVRDLAIKIGLKRTTAYLYIDQLVEKGLVAKLVKGAHKMVAANNPEDSLQALVKQKEEKAKYLQSDFSSIITNISSTLANPVGLDEFEIKYFKGMNCVKRIYEEALQSSEIRSYVKIVEKSGVFEDDIKVFNEAFKKNKNLKIWEILYDSPTSREQAFGVLSENDSYQYKLMPKDMKLTSEDILIYDGKVAIINYKDKISCVVLNNISYYNNSKELFDFIWKLIP